MKFFSHKEFDNHEHIAFFSDEESGLKAIVAIHNTTLGPAIGGCRMFPYASDEEALTDVLRLSKGMTYKSALAGLHLGGGKSVIIGDPRKDKTPKLLHAFGRCLEQLGGHYITAEDSGTSIKDIREVGTQTAHVAGVRDRVGFDGLPGNGDPSPATAWGVYTGILSAVRHKMNRSDLDGIRVTVQGLGNVGYRLASHLTEAGASVYVSDIHRDILDQAIDELGVTAVAPDDLFATEMDVFAPCAMGAVINDETIPRLSAAIVAGAANNQLKSERHGLALMERGILYAPDYVINAGGIIDVSHEREQYESGRVRQHIEGIGDTLSEIFERSERDGIPTVQEANRLAEERLNQGMVT
ncbi:Leu/Phe/Val dehydrogenase [Endozoicomonadaceae bacterium StTr2]